MTKAIAHSLVCLSITSTLASSQALTVVRPSPTPLDPTTSNRLLEAARPLLGYLTDSSNVVRSVVGSASRPQWGVPLALPDQATVAYLPPRQEYALLASETGLLVARLSRSTMYPGAVIPNAMPRPERVSFSPSGEAAALFSSAESRIEVVTSLPAKAQLGWSILIANPSELVQFTLSDDGQLLVATFANQPPAYSWHGSAWQLLSTNYRLDASTFLPRSHDLVLSDRTQKTIVFLAEAGKAPSTERLLSAGDIDANLLSTNKQGSQLLAVAAGTAAAWSIDLLTGAVAPILAKESIDSITLLRDGQTFLVSTKDAPLLMKLDGAVAQAGATGIVP